MVNGKRPRFTYDTKGEAETKAQQLRIERENGDHGCDHLETTQYFWAFSAFLDAEISSATTEYL
jgi:hypothetical protein